MPEARSCCRCGAALPPDAPGGHCVPCLLQLGLMPDLAADPAEPDAAPVAPPLNDAPPGVQPGERFGRYKLLQKISEGGCGIVYMAEQEQPVRRKVALKVIKLGMDTRQVIARFEAERQALALMDHPNIARIFDAGVVGASGRRLEVRGRRTEGAATLLTSDLWPLSSGSGRPYFVMELVRGIKITDYCDQHQLDTVQRLGLFIQICQAVQHAHQKGIIHRDLKPSNILVTENDGVPVPKVIDFGIAKATTDQRLTDKTLFTAFEQFLGTPAYMSPEQAALTSLDIDTRSDIYSLGVLLYELLTGQTPFDTKTLLAAGLDELRRTIREEEPLRPSKVVERLSELRVERAGKAILSAQLKFLSTDLDWIVMKCLEKDRTRRYETASGLARDIQRYLDDEPVVACPPSKRYRLQKLVRRNKLVFAAGSAVGITLLVGLGVSTWLFLREQAAHRQAKAAAQAQVWARREAQAEAAKSREVAQFLRSLLTGVGSSVTGGHDAAWLREILDRAAERVRQDLTNQPAVEVELRLTLADTYQAMGLYPPMEQMARAALELSRARLGPESPAVADALERLSTALVCQGHLDRAEMLSRQALALRLKLFGDNHPRVARSLAHLGGLLAAQGRGAESEDLERQALALRRRLLGNDDPELVESLNSLALALLRHGKVTEAEAAVREALAITQRLPQQESPELAVLLRSLAAALVSQGQLPQAEVLLRQALSMDTRLLGNTHPAVAGCLDSLADVLLLEHKPDAIQPLFDERLTLAVARQPRSAYLLAALANVRARQGRWQEAAANAAQATEFEPADHNLYHMLTPLLVADGNLESYRAYCQRILARFRDTQDSAVADRMAKDCLILPSSGVDLTVVARLADTAVARGGSHGNPFLAFGKSLAEYRQGHFTGAIAWARKALAHEGENPRRDVGAYAVLAMAHHHLDQTDPARAALAKSAHLAATRLAPLASGDIGDGWIDWIIAHALLSEATALLDAGPPQNHPPPVSGQ